MTGNIGLAGDTPVLTHSRFTYISPTFMFAESMGQVPSV